MARTFDRSDLRVALVESGGFEYSARSQELYAGEVTGIPDEGYLTRTRLRMFGGNQWGDVSTPRRDRFHRTGLSPPWRSLAIHPKDPGPLTRPRRLSAGSLYR